MRFEVSVGLKQEVLDVEGRAILDTLKRMGYSQFSDVRVRKEFEIEVVGAQATEAEQAIREASATLLANPVYQTFKITQVPE